MTLLTNGRLITRDCAGRGYYEHGAEKNKDEKIIKEGE